MFTSKRRALIVGIVAPFVLLTACSEPECPVGTYKVQNICRKLPDAEVEGVVAVEPDDAAKPPTERGTTSTEDAQTGAESGDAGTPSSGSVLSGSGGMTAGMLPSETSPSTSARPDAGTNPQVMVPTGPAPECDATQPCSQGYACVSNKCVSMCEQTQCSANAACALVAGAPTCSCNTGFVARRETNGSITCLESQTCTQARCDPNADCTLDVEQQAKCACKAGYTGTGKTCAPVSCPMLSIANGMVTGGTTYNQTATYRCNAGYKLNTVFAKATRTCGSNMMWSGTAPRCDPVDCGMLAAPTNGRVTYAPTGSTTYGATARYTCDSGYVLNSTITSRTCQADPTTWSGGDTTPKCIGCGDGEVTRDQFLSEECDPRAPGESAWTCSSQCRRTTAYKFCVIDQECSPGEVCNAPTGCTRSCPATCPAAVPPTRATCVTGAPFWMVTNCTVGGNDCPPGQRCSAAPTVGANLCTF